jgi:O-antigen/teichoic acid export membrane protein
MNSRQLFWNAAANVLSGVFGAAASIVIPFTLAHRLPADQFAVWSVIFQATAYTALFTLGLQSVVAQRVAASRASGDEIGIARTLKATGQLAAMTTIAYMLLAASAAVALPILYPDIPRALTPIARWSLLAYAVGLASTLLTVGSQGYFAGSGRSQITTSTIVPNRLLMVVAAWLASSDGALLPVAMSLGAVLLSGSIHQLLVLRIDRRRANPRVTTEPVGQLRRSILFECAPLALWSMATFLIYGGTTTIVSVSDYGALPSYSLATSLSGLLLGLLGTAFAPMITYVAGRLHHATPDEMQITLERFTAYAATASLIMLVGVLMLGGLLLARVLPAVYVEPTWHLATLQIAANSIRLLMLPYSNLVIANKQQHRILTTPLVEALGTFGAALILAPQLGAEGVAIAMVCGACASVLHHFFWNMPALVGEIPVQRQRFGSRLILPSLTGIGTVLGIGAWAC